MRSYLTCNIVLACALGLFSLLAAPARLQAQTYADPEYSCSIMAPCEAENGCCHSQCGVFPRTYSYYYDRWFNQPCHTRVVGPDGCSYWTRTVRGLPFGTPWNGR